MIVNVFSTPYFLHMFPNDNLLLVLTCAGAALGVEIITEGKSPFPQAASVMR